MPFWWKYTQREKKTARKISEKKMLQLFSKEDSIPMQVVTNLKKPISGLYLK